MRLSTLQKDFEGSILGSVALKNDSILDLNLQPTVITSNVAPGSESKVQTDVDNKKCKTLLINQQTPDYKRQNGLERISLMIDQSSCRN